MKPRVLATTGFLADITARIAGSSAEVHSLLPTGSDPHRYEAVPDDTKKLAEARLIVLNGLNLEGWLDKLIRQAATEAPRVVASRGIVAIQDPDHAGSFDPHAWMDPLLGRTYARNIYLGLLELLPQDSLGLRRRWQAYDLQLLDLHRKILKTLGPVPARHRVLGTTHDAFRYFAKRYQFEVITLLGTSTDAEVRTADVLRMQEVIAQKDLPCIFVEANLNPKLLQQIARDAGCTLGPPLFADSMGPEGSGADTYLDMLLYNASMLAKGLGGLPSEGSKPGATASVEEDGQATNSVWWVLLLMLPALGFLYLSLEGPHRRKSTGDEKDAAHADGVLLSVRNLSVTYERKSVLNAFSADFQSGKCYGILGPNGAGKSTLFKAILGLTDPDHGSIWHPTPLAYVPQKGLVDWDFPATVRDIVQMGRLPWRKAAKDSGPWRRQVDADRAAVLEAMKALELTELQDRPLNQLSGGQQQRVFLARALAQGARVLMLDEPFVGVDAATEAKIMEVLHRFTRQEGGLVLMIHHDLQRSRLYFDEVLLINQRLIAQGPPQEVLQESTLLVAFSGVDPTYEDAAQYRNTRT